MSLESGGDNTLLVDDLSIADGAALDLADNDLIIPAPAGDPDSMLGRINGLIATALNSPAGEWMGTGLTSRNLPGSWGMGLAAIRNQRFGQPLYSSFSGQPVDSKSILVRSTWNGDTNLDRRIDADDYYMIDQGYISGLAGYQNGDFNYDKVIDINDYFLIDVAVRAQIAVQPSGLVAQSLVSLKDQVLGVQADGRVASSDGRHS